MDLRRLDLGSCSESRREMWVAWQPEQEGIFVPTVHANCPHNELWALALRSFAPLPEPVFRPVSGGTLSVFHRLKRIVRAYSGHTWSGLETALSYDGGMRRRYVEAERSLRIDGPVDWSDSYLRPFLKAEKPRSGSKLAKPRLIYPRSPRYNLELARRLKPFEHWLWGYLTTKRLFNMKTSTRVVAKGLNPRQRANLIVRKFLSIPDCVAFEVDGVAFEAHVGPSQLQHEHSIYLSAIRDPKLRRLLGEQMSLRGKLSCGAKFSRPGGRASGDFNTGMGNSLIMLAVVVGVLRQYKVPFDVLVDGDNALVFLSRGDSGRVVSTFARHAVRECGQELLLESPVDYIEGIRFGGSAPIYLGPRMGWSMVREWHRVLGGGFASHRFLREPVFARSWIRGVSMCELSLARGVPVLQAWALGGLNATEEVKRVRAHPYIDYFVVGGWLAGRESAVPVSHEARESFHRAFGLEPNAQIELEQRVLHLVIGDLSRGSYRQYLGDSHDGWMNEPGLHERWIDSHI